MTQYSEHFVQLAPVLLVKPTGRVKAYGLGATSDAARGVALAAAVAAAASGDVVEVKASCSVTSSLVLPAGCTLRGVGMPAITGSGLSDAMIRIAASNVTVESLRLSNNTTCLGAHTGASGITAQNLVLRDLVVTVTDTIGNAICWSDSELAGSTTNTLSVDIHHCVLTGGTNGLGGGGFGVRANLSASSRLRLFDCVVFGDTDAVLVAGSSTASIEIYGGHYSSTLDAITSGGPPIHCFFVRARGEQADLFADNGQIHAYYCQVRPDWCIGGGGGGGFGTLFPTEAGAALLDDLSNSAQRTTLGLGTIATQAASNVSISGGGISGITDLAVADGGTGSSTASGARTNLGLVIDTDVASILAATTQGRLTLESGVPISTTDQTAKTTIYFTPYQGNKVALYDGSKWKLHAFTERSLALGTLTSGAIYDVFLYDNAGTLTLELSAAWTNGTTRADALALQDGVSVKSGAATRKWIGTFRTTSATTTEDSAGGTITNVGGKRLVWNQYNRVQRHIMVIDTTDSWSYTTDTIRQARANAGNQVDYVTGDAALIVRARAIGNVSVASNTRSAKVGVGVDSTSGFSGFVGSVASGGAGLRFIPAVGNYVGTPGLGGHVISWNERGADGTSTFIGDNGGTEQTGLVVLIEG